jgi:hypothetical protein
LEGLGKTLLFRGLIYPISQLAPLGRIMEIGTYDGEHAKQTIETAKKLFPANEVEYYGFDLFELFDEHKLKEELSKKPLRITSLSGSLRKQEQRYSF